MIGLGQALKDRYTLERELGRGEMAAVYLAHDLKQWYERSRNIQNWLLPSAIFDRVRDAPEFRQAIERMDQWHRTEFDLARWRQPRPQD